MNAAYKQEKKKNSKRKTHNITPLSFKITDPLFYAEDSPCPKKLKDNLFLSFPDETVLSTAQSDASEIKTELLYHLDKPDVHWAAQRDAVETDYWNKYCTMSLVTCSLAIKALLKVTGVMTSHSRWCCLPRMRYKDN